MVKSPPTREQYHYFPTFSYDSPLFLGDVPLKPPLYDGQIRLFGRLRSTSPRQASEELLLEVRRAKENFMESFKAGNDGPQQEGNYIGP